MQRTARTVHLVIAGVAAVAVSVALVAQSTFAIDEPRPAAAAPLDRAEPTAPVSAEVAGPAPAPTTTAPPQPLAPVPPADGRDAPDPFLLDDGDEWVLFSTQVGLLNVPASTSSDLAAWSAPVEALPVLPAWAEWGHTWAPGAVARPGGYVLYFAARSRATGRQCIGAASSISATGPFTSPSAEPLVCQAELGGSIDPHPFVDRDGTAYLFWKADGNAIGQASWLFGQRLRPDGLGFDGEPVALLRNDATWERPLIENPALVRAGTGYSLLYSGGWWESGGYATGYATCDTPLGPCTKVTVDGPVHASNDGEAGPGGAMVISGPAGDHWLVYHAWSSGHVGYGSGGARSLRFAPVAWEGTTLVIAP